jgi:hypothetical protein
VVARLLPLLLRQLEHLLEALAEVAIGLGEEGQAPELADRVDAVVGDGELDAAGGGRRAHVPELLDRFAAHVLELADVVVDVRDVDLRGGGGAVRARVRRVV